MRKARRGSMFLEACIAVVILAAACIAVAQLLALAAHQRRVLDQQRLAIAEAANVMERVMGLSWDELTNEQLAGIALSPQAAEQLDGGDLKIEIIEKTEPPAGKQIRLALSWIDFAGQTNEPVQLTAWKYRLEGAATP